jgi:hypothetical protein
MRLGLLAIIAVAWPWMASAQPDIECQSGDGRRITIAGSTACPLGLSPVTPSAAPSSGANTPSALPRQPAGAQAFRCPDRGNLLTYATLDQPAVVIGERISLGQDGLSCFYLVRAKADSAYADSQYFAGFWRVLTPAEQEFVRQVGPSALWPLEVGKKFESEVTTADGRVRVRIAVEGHEEVALPVGKMPAYVVRVRELAGDGTNLADRTFWWAPELGDVVQFSSREKDAAAGGWQIVSISR